MLRKQDSGLTMVEIIIVVAILAVLGAILVPNLLAAKVASNETAAIATLRSLVTAEAQMLGSAKIDADKDSIGEYGTFVELIGHSGVRTRVATLDASDFTNRGSAADPPALSETMVEYMQKTGYLTKTGYAFMIFLPDTNDPARFTHENLTLVTTGKGKKKTTVENVVLVGGTARVGINISESAWCAYAQPLSYSRSGRRAFFTNQQGDILQSQNDVAKHQDDATAIAGRSAFTGTGITSDPAVGTRGRDGDVWKVTN